MVSSLRWLDMGAQPSKDVLVRSSRSPGIASCNVLTQEKNGRASIHRFSKFIEAHGDVSQFYCYVVFIRSTVSFKACHDL